MSRAEQIEATIAAVATPAGPGGIGIIRVSGTAALPILKSLFRPRQSCCRFESHRLHYGWITDRNGQPVDEVLAVYMRGPRTYTREDVVEVHCHGSYLVLAQILTEVLAAGARLAEPGESPPAFAERCAADDRVREGGRNQHERGVEHAPQENDSDAQPWRRVPGRDAEPPVRLHVAHVVERHVGHQKSQSDQYPAVGQDPAQEAGINHGEPSACLLLSLRAGHIPPLQVPSDT